MGWIPLLLIPAIVLIVGTQIYTMRTYRRFRKIDSGAGMTGAQVARELLDRHGLPDIAIREVNGVLSDRYDTRERTIRLSRENYRSNSVAALGIAAHETGHALQAHDLGHIFAKGTGVLTLRMASMLIQVTGWGAVIAFSLLFIGWLSSWSDMMAIGILVFLGAVCCSLLTLPVEMNANRRALALLESGGYLTEQEMDGARTVLRAASWSYTVTVGTALIQFFRDLIQRDDDYP
jgi:Zn-dependent membrane protease YugP